MAQRIYSSIIDAFLDDRAPDWDAVGLAQAKKEGDKQLARTHDYEDFDYAELTDDEEASSHHTPVPSVKAAGGPPVSSQFKREEAARVARVEAARNEHMTHMARKDNVTPVRGTTDDWARRSARRAEDFVSDISNDNKATAEKLFGLGAANDPNFLKAREVSDNEAKKFVRDLLNAGLEPRRVAALIEKQADLRPFNKSMAQDYLTQQSGVLGLAYIEPNQYLDKCPDSYERMNKITGSKKIRAASVKQIKACEGCQFFKKNGNSKTCNLYHLPIVANAKELNQVINKMTAGVPADQKKAALVKIANREGERVAQPTGSDMISRVATTTHQTSIEAVAEKHVASNPEFTAAEVTKLHAKGASLEAIYKLASNKAGTVKAAKAVREFIAGLKQSGSKIALSQIDCKFLKNKLGMRNAIVGAPKCGSCTFRSGMHCGLTGGTLISFPGMDKAASNIKIAADAPKDGVAELNEYDLTSPVTMADIGDNPDPLKVR